MPALLFLPSLVKRHPIDSPLSDQHLQSRNVAPPSPSYTPGSGAFDPHDINNKGFFALFALLGAAMVIASIWFFFIAKNGGFRFRKGDWDDYKSTVLRRKGPDGKTLSGATKTTVLGGGSIVAGRDSDYDGYTDSARTEETASVAGTFNPAAWARKKGAKFPKSKGLRGGAGSEPKRAAAANNKKQKQKQKQTQQHKGPRGSKNSHDPDMRAYRHEKPAQVGGLNRQTDSTAYSHHDFAYSDNPYSEMSERDDPAGYNPFRDSAATAASTSRTPENKRHSAAASKMYTHSPNDSSGSHRPLRPHRPSRDSTPTRSNNHNNNRRRSSPNKGGSSYDAHRHHHQHHRRQSSHLPGSFYTEPLDFESRYSKTNSNSTSDIGTEDSRGTKAYFHPIPGLGAGNGSAGHGYAHAGGGGGGGVGNGFRRAEARGRGRRDSLSDSEGETGTAFS